MGIGIQAQDVSLAALSPEHTLLGGQGESKVHAEVSSRVSWPVLCAHTPLPALIPVVAGIEML